VDPEHSRRLTADIDRVIGYFNARKLDLPDGFFDRRTQFVINGAPFETLLGQSANDPLVLMLARGPAGFRFSTKALQHAIPDATIERGEVTAGADPFKISIRLWLSGKLRGTGETLNTVASVRLRLATTGHVEIAEAELDDQALEKIREARLRP
jgi:hypothetical protein